MKKLLFTTIFEKAKNELETEETNTIAKYVSSTLDSTFANSRISSKTIGRYIDLYVKNIDIKDCKSPTESTLNILSRFIGYESYNQFATEIRKNEKTTTHNYNADKMNITHIKDNSGDIHNY